MKKIFVGLLSCFGGFCVVCAHSGGRVISVRPNIKVAGVEVGGLTIEEAEKSLRVWWEDQKMKPLKLHSAKLSTEIPDMHASELGVALDDVATVASLPKQDSFADPKASTSKEEYAEKAFEPIYKLNGLVPSHLEALVQKAYGLPKPARVIVVKKQIVRQPEVTTEVLDIKALLPAVAKAIKDNEPVELPIVESEKRVTDNTLAQITDLVSAFSTHFPKRQFNRNANIKLASSRLNGVVLLPGEQLSFNKTVGERTVKEGFKLAGVYKNGKHDTGIGGGICQVSTTLYNASLFGNLKIVRRSNHSMPVAYVPLGRDATVDYGSLDLVIENNYETPIAISSEYQPGTLMFRVLGKKTEGLSVKIAQVDGKAWDRSVKVIHDPKLPAGKKVVVEKGSRGHSIRTYRLVFKDGKLVSKQPLGFSYYGGGDKIIAVGPDKAAVLNAPGLPLTKVRPAVVQSSSGG